MNSRFEPLICVISVCHFISNSLWSLWSCLSLLVSYRVTHGQSQSCLHASPQQLLHSCWPCPRIYTCRNTLPTSCRCEHISCDSCIWSKWTGPFLAFDLLRADGYWHTNDNRVLCRSRMATRDIFYLAFTLSSVRLLTCIKHSESQSRWRLREVKSF
jgi:hypothetical protein